MERFISIVQKFRQITITPFFIFGFLALLIFSIFFIVNTWNQSMRETEEEAMQLAMAAESGFQKSHITNLHIDRSDLEREEYGEIKDSLMDLVLQRNDIRFAYIFVQKEEKIYFLADSEPPESSDYSPPGQEYWETDEEFLRLFHQSEPILMGPTTDRWGTWMSVLVPMLDSLTNETYAVFGVDYPAESWENHAVIHSIQAGIVVFCMFLIYFAFFLVFNQNSSLRHEREKLLALDKKLRESETLFRTVFDQAPIGIAIGRNDEHGGTLNTEYGVSINPMFERITGREEAELARVNWTEITHPDDVPVDLAYFEKFKSGEIKGYEMDKRYLKPDGSVAWVHMMIAPLNLASNPKYNHICLIEDITVRKDMEKALFDNERSKAVLLDNLPGMAYRCKTTRDWTMVFISQGCFQLTGYQTEQLLNNNELSFSELIVPEYRELLWEEWSRVLDLKEQFKSEYEIITAAGEKKWVLEIGQGVYGSDGMIEALEGIIIDITESKRNLLQIQYMNDHDSMTDLYNRRYFEEVKHLMDRESCLPLSIIVGDINGVRLINDAFGIEEGDRIIQETARIFRSCCRDGDVLARTGGDEFCMLLPNTEHYEVNETLKKIESCCEEYNLTLKDKAKSINLSIGYGTKQNLDESIQSAEKEAEESMHKRKLLERSSYHSAIVSSIMATLYERSQETEEHAKRLACISKLIGEKMHLPKKSLDEIELFAMLHDIGKIGIDDRVLNKPGKLSEEEWVIMKKHPEIGYRIAMATTELQPIAEYVLTHHERWDGKGYPQGLTQESIPLISRILAVVDAFDAMTENRVYRKAMARDFALEEIRRNTGTQFDPDIVKIFSSVIESFS
ncbi:HD domain-containing phosphohydrolase [Sinanaerobacter chloroacetimidivorans]|jgi:diguanylate cyclase (GGDEF)-like protein/PAS domain S-box-containing protein|uniref:Diguanylate cyclase n=1 Tax=Sinanaerobacter chloroacetimidivorans TaxID=2818044 RepID=A0A8J7VYN1_9FIRM|nr:HD domain-containing phosphohydrolase [Sinanaerobacter chloroacetimidivorans]MBR0597096.1 diguanylate cyclase [Sinanaerobacter chloroacetimidivorans]